VSTRPPGEDTRSHPRVVRWTVLAGLIGLVAAVPFSAPDGTGMQWDELVLGCVAASASWALFSRARTMSRAAARPWRLLGVASAMFTVAQLLAGAFPGPEFDGFGVDDVLLLIGATMPLVSAGMLARRVRRTRWSALVVDGAMVTLALMVVTEVVRAPLVNPVNAPDDLRSLVLAYGGYAAVMLGTGAALCTVSNASLRRSVTTMVGAISLQAVAATCEAMAIVAPSWLWTAGSDVAVALALQVTVVAASRAPATLDRRSARAANPVVSPVGLALLVVAVLALPLAIGTSLLEHQPLTVGAQLAISAVFVLLAVRLVLRIREDGRVTEDLVRHEEDFRELVESSSDGVVIVDDDLTLLLVSPVARTMLGLPDGAEDVELTALVDPEDRALVRAALRSPNGPDLHFRVADRELEGTSTAHPGSGRRVLYLRDVTRRLARERELERMAYTDHLTGLPNRALLFQELDRRVPEERCLLVLDLDGFKAVNDVAGHEAGDHLLVEMARRLQTLVREDDLVARLGGDEFAVVVSGTLEESVEVAARVVDALALPHRTADRSFAVGASVGVAQLSSAGGQAAFREADDALRAAKQAGKGCVRVADQAAHDDDGLDLAAALRKGELELRYDAVTAPDGRVTHVQARAVWLHPERGRIDGQDLWAVAEKQGLLLAVQRWGVRLATREIAAMDGELGLFLRLPSSQVPGDVMIAELTAALEASGLAPSRLTITLTEETLLTSPAGLLPALERVRDSGVRLVLSDYGMGHSLFAMLARLSLDGVRVAIGALAGRDDDARALQVLAAIVRTTTSFGLTTIADGIDTPSLRDGALAAGAEFVAGRIAPEDLRAAEVAALLAAAALAR
jgi:diguanylate cyclase (GGDEF)-like protein